VDGLRGTGRAGGFGALPPEERRIVFPAVLLHDMGKPATTRLAWTDGSRLAGTGRCGAIQAWPMLCGLGVLFPPASTCAR